MTNTPPTQLDRGYRQARTVLGPRVMPYSVWSGPGGYPCAFISVLTLDRPGVLQAVLGLLAGDDGGVGSSRYSVVASLSASLAGVGAVGVVVRGTPEGPSLSSAVVRRALHESVRRTVSDVVGGAAAEEFLRIEIELIAEPTDDDLFAGRVLREYRIALLRNGGVSNDPVALPEVISEVSAVLARSGLPIPYFHFYHRWAGPSGISNPHPVLAWLRVACAPRVGRLSDQTSVDLQLLRIAERVRMAVASYDSCSEAPEFSQRFTQLAPVGELASADLLPFCGIAADRQAVVLTAKARVGLVNDVFALVGEFVQSATMTVLYGQSVFIFALPAAVAPNAAMALARISSADNPVVFVGPVVPEGEVANPLDPPPTFWVAWVYPDAPGVFRRVLDAAVSSAQRAVAIDVSVDYAISRVLADGETCAGKVKLIVRDAQTPETAVGGALEAVREALADVLPRPSERLWSPHRPEWFDRRFAVQRSEPTEEPWATLSVLGDAVETSVDLLDPDTIELTDR